MTCMCTTERRQPMWPNHRARMARYALVRWPDFCRKRNTLTSCGFAWHTVRQVPSTSSPSAPACSSPTRGSIPFPADGPAVVAVGAVSLDGHRLLYSSCGPPTHRNRSPTWLPRCRFRVCGVLSLSPEPRLPHPKQQPWLHYGGAAIRAGPLPRFAALCSAAHDLGPPGHDYETGYGLIALP